MNNNQTALLIPEPQQAIQPITPLSMIQLALQQNAPVEVLRDLFQLKKEVEADEARKAYARAKADFTGEAIRVVKDKENSQYKTAGGKPSRYVSLGNLVSTVIPYLSKHSLSARWDIDQTSGIKVTCILTHSMGHSESVAMTCPPDKQGAKSPIQEIKSAITYAKVCTFESICGLASTEGNLDDDGNGSAPHKDALPDEKSIPLQEAIKYARDMAELKEAFKKAYKMAVTVKDQNAFSSLYEARKRDLL